jgi:tetratricopeptide (TPR) repeat protein
MQSVGPLSEASIREALDKVDDPALIAAVIPKAEHVLQIRASHQGDNWWQTIHAREDLADLRRLFGMPEGERASLAAAERAADQVQIMGPPEGSKNDQVIDILLATARTESQILGEEHPWYAASLYRVGRAYYAQFRYTESESYYRRALDIHRKSLDSVWNEREHPLVN